MKPTQSWQIRQQYQKAERKKQVTRVALQVYMEQGIELTTMNDVATRASIGIASVYRYFKTKQELVIDSASLFWQEEVRKLFDLHERNATHLVTGLEKALNFLEIYLELYDNGKQFFRFTEQFDQFVIRDKIQTAQLGQYNQTLSSIRQIFEKAIVTGIQDGSIRPDIEVARFSATAPLALLSLAQKLISRERTTTAGQPIPPRSELELLIEMIRVYLTRREK